MKKPTGWIVGRWEYTSENAYSGTPCRAFSMRQAMRIGKSWTKRGNVFFFTLTPVWGPMA